MNLTNRLEEVYKSGWLDCREDTEYWSKLAPNNNAEVISQIETDLIALVGEDEKVVREAWDCACGQSHVGLSDDGVPYRNNLKKELRAAIKQYCNGGNDE